MKKVSFVFILAVVFGLLAVGSVWAGVINVDVNDPSCVSGSGQADPYSVVYCSIQDAIDDAISGDTINVAAGTYYEAVTIDKRIHLIGAKAGIDPCGGAWTGAVSLINPGSGKTGVDVQSSDVIVSGFEVTGGEYGIYIGSVSVNHVIISYNDLHNNSKYGLQAIGLGSDISFINVLINYMHNNGRNGLKLVDVTDCWIYSNEFAYNGFGSEATKPEYKYGVFLEDERYNAPIYSPCIRNTFIGNSFHDNQKGAINMEVMGNATGSYWTSTEFLEGTVVLHNNFYSDSLWGVNVDNDYKDDGTQDGFGPIATVHAINNWWGSPRGPSQQLSNGKDVGKGAKVSSNVDFEPWLQLAVRFWKR